MILQKSKWRMHLNESVRTMLLHRGGGGEVLKKMILQKSKWRMHSNESVRTMLLHRGGGGRLKKKNDFAKVKVENALWILLLEAIKLLSCWETLLSC